MTYGSRCLFVLAACGKSAPQVADVGPANQAVPQQWRYRLTFVPRELADPDIKMSFNAPMPEGWLMKPRFGRAEATDVDAFGKSSMTVDVNCVDVPECKPRDWAALLDRDVLASLKVDREERGQNRLLVVGRRRIDNQRTVSLAWWTDGADHYNYCRADLDAPLEYAVDAFVKACEAVVTR